MYNRLNRELLERFHGMEVYVVAAFTYPGVYIEELPSGVHPITGVATSIAAFVGWANQGPTTPQLVLSFSDYARMYGGLFQGSPLGYAVSHFFVNGGRHGHLTPHHER